MRQPCRAAALQPCSAAAAPAVHPRRGASTNRATAAVLTLGAAAALALAAGTALASPGKQPHKNKPAPTFRFRPPMVITIPGSATRFAVGPLTRSRRPDIVTADNDGTVSVILNLGHGKFAKPVAYKVSPNHQVTDVAIADVNHDGIPDIVAVVDDGTGATTFGVLLGNGNGTFRTPIVSAGTVPKAGLPELRRQRRDRRLGWQREPGRGRGLLAPGEHHRRRCLYRARERPFRRGHRGPPYFQFLRCGAVSDRNSIEKTRAARSHRDRQRLRLQQRRRRGVREQRARRLQTDFLGTQLPLATGGCRPQRRRECRPVRHDGCLQRQRA